MNQSYISNVCYLIPLWFPMVCWLGASLQRSDLRLKDLRELKVTSRSGFVWESTLPLYLPFLRWGPQTGEYSMIWCDLIWHYMMWHCMMWYDMTWHDIVWHDMIWTVMIWTVMNCYELLWTVMIYYHMIFSSVLKPPANERLQVLMQNESFSIAKSTNLGEYVDDLFGFFKQIQVIVGMISCQLVI